MKIILKDGTEYQVLRIVKNNILNINNSEYADMFSNSDVKYVNSTTILLDLNKNSMSNLFDIETDFNKDNISEVTFVTSNNDEIKEKYDMMGKIAQNVSDYINETTIVLLNYQK